MVKLLKYSWLLVILVVAGAFQTLSAQDTPTIFIEGRISTASGKKLGGATITVKKNGAPFQTITTASNGKYADLELPMGFEYTMTVSYDGYLSKTIAIDAKTGYYEEDSPQEIPLDIPFELDGMKPDVDYSPVSNGFQIGKLAIDPATGGVAPDMSYSGNQKNKYEQFFKKLEEEANKEEEEFKKFVENGDKAFESGNYSDALSSYQKAQEIKQGDPGVTGKITSTEEKIEQKKSFDQAVSAGDGALSAKNYDEAIAKYEKAKSIMPDDKKIDAKIEDAKAQKEAAAGAEIDAKYNAKMDEANKAFADKDYAYAKSLYQEAGGIKPDEKEPPAKVKECEDIIKEQMEAEQAFNELVAAGDKGMLDEDYDTAIEKYTAALELKDDSRVSSELAKAKELKKKKEEEEANAAKKAEFDQLIADGNDKLSSEDFDAAIAKYTEALNTGFDNATANSKIKEAEAAKKAKEDAEAAAALKEEFDQFIADGNDKLGSEDFDAAIAKYTEALNTGFDNATANAKIKEAEDAKAAKEDAEAAAAKQEQFDQLIADGNDKLGSEDFDAAIAKYTEALDLDVDNPTANAKIKEAEDAKAAKEDAEAAAAKQEQFDQLIADGNDKLGSEDFDAAIAKYTEALDLGVDNATANAKIKEAEDAKAAKEDAAAAAAKQEQFDQFIADGDGKLGSEDFDAAIAKYTEALDLGVDDPTANAKIKEAEDAKAAKEDAAAAAAKQEQFDQLIADGNDKLGSEDFDAAISKYTEALDLGVDNPTANAKIKEAEDAKVAKNEADQEAANQEQFDQFIADGDTKLGSEDFDSAIDKYTQALDLDVDNATANAKIKEAEDAKAAYEADLAAKNAEEQQQAKFDQLISSGDGKLGDKDFDSAISDYQAALDLDVNNTLANQKIKEAEDAKLAYENEMAAQNEAAKQAEFDKFIDAGDGHLSSKAFDMAIGQYESALGLNVDNDLANQKIQEAKDAKAEYESQMAADEAAAAKEKQFNDLIAQGDAAKDAEDWATAKDLYTQAKEVKEDSPIPQQKIDEVNELMKKQLEAEQNVQLQKYLEKGKEITDDGEYDKAIGLYNKAKGLFPGETILDERIEEVKALKKKAEEFNQLIASGDGKLGSESFDGAIADYQQALNLGVDNATAQAKIDEAKAAKQAKLDAANAADEMAEKKAKYQELMNKAKSQKDAEKYQEAIATYTEAKNVLPSENEPQQRIDEINDLLAKLANKNELLEKYQDAIAKADAKRDEAIAAKSDDLAVQAKDLYNEANKIKSDESYPQEQVNKLSNLMEEWANIAANAQYQKIIDKADELFAAKNWDGAEELYGRANDLKPVDPYPPAQLEKIKNARANAGKLDAYNEFVQEGNSLFQEKKYQKAIEAYQGALGEKPGAKYPKDKIAEIQDLMSQASQAQKDKQAKETAIKVDPYYQGEEISMTEEEIEKMWDDVRVDEITDKDGEYDGYKEKVGTETVENAKYQTGKTQTINDKYEEMDQTFADNHQTWDQQRKDVLPEIEDFKEKEKDKLQNYSDDEMSRAYDLDDYYNESEQERAEYDINLDNNREDNIVDMEVYKESQIDINNELVDQGISATYDTHQDYRDRAEEYELFAEDGDKRRKEETVIQMDDYKELQTDITLSNVEESIEKTDAVNEYNVEYHDYLQDFSEDSDNRRQDETVVQMDEYKELQTDITLSNVEESVKKTDEVNEYNVEYQDYLQHFADEMDMPREDNVSAMEIYQDEKMDDYQDDLKTNEERSQQNYLDKDKIKEDQATLMDEESAMVENNMEDMEAYKDQKSDENEALNKDFQDVGYNNSLSMDSVKTQKATMFSDENVDALANQYPEGITEKTFQRTNNLGEVVEITIVRIVVRGNKADEYKKVTSKWNTAYFKNGGIINEYIWDTETN